MGDTGFTHLHLHSQYSLLDGAIHMDRLAPAIKARGMNIGENLKLPSEFTEHLQRYQDFHHYPFLTVYFYCVNTREPPMDDVRVRRALSLAIDREAIVKYVTRAGQPPPPTLSPMGSQVTRADRTS